MPTSAGPASRRNCASEGPRLAPHPGRRAIRHGRQLAHLPQAAETSHVDLQVVPFSAGAAASQVLPFTLLTFEASPTVLYSDDPEGGRLYDRAASVAAALQSYERLRAHAMAPDESVALIQRLHKEYTHE
ncbi:Scr1 family TA system antitoxin-like transcriptional regulator [Streptomyces lonarensis]|uniref:Scr1 family TA system antitoxin-like transcriptional regulator n=1 Tax=Streptomyces lonarensis TaxID=700599 RepID=UPI0028ABA4E2|nr:Scr1 family TA system antitoxin-like transcriptional regulator [Streptomyces lonarensis]